MESFQLIPRTPSTWGCWPVPPTMTSSAVQEDGGFQSCSCSKLGQEPLSFHKVRSGALKTRKHDTSFKSPTGSPLEAQAPQAASITSNFTFRLMFFQTFLGSPCSHFLSPFSLQMYLCIKESGRKNCSFRVTAERGLYY